MLFSSLFTTRCSVWCQHLLNPKTLRGSNTPGLLRIQGTWASFSEGLRNSRAHFPRIRFTELQQTTREAGHSSGGQSKHQANRMINRGSAPQHRQQRKGLESGGEPSPRPRGPAICTWSSRRRDPCSGPNPGELPRDGTGEPLNPAPSVAKLWVMPPSRDLPTKEPPRPPCCVP